MASLPLSCKAKSIQSAKTPQSSPCSRTAVASFTPLSLLNFSASGIRVVSSPIPITAPMSLSVFSIPKFGQSGVAFSIGISKLVGGCWVRLGSLVGIARFVVDVVGLIYDHF